MHFIIGLPMRATSNQEMSRVYVQKKKTKWRTELPEVFACPIPASMWLIFAGRGRVISGLLADRFGSQFRMSTNLLCGVRAIFV